MSCFSRPAVRVGLLALVFALPGCRKSPTAKEIKGFADKVCACADAPCAEAVQVEYLEWWKGNLRARGSEGDRKGVEKSMQRYAECHLALVGPESAAVPTVKAPKVNLQPPARAPRAAGEDGGAAKADPAKASEAAAKASEAAAKALEAAAKGEVSAPASALLPAKAKPE